jgi:hypothetical protein
MAILRFQSSLTLRAFLLILPSYTILCILTMTRTELFLSYVYQIVCRVWRYVSAVYNTVNVVSGGTNLYFSCGSEFVHIVLPWISVLSGVMLLCRWISGSRRFDPLSSLRLLLL